MITWLDIIYICALINSSKYKLHKEINVSNVYKCRNVFPISNRKTDISFSVARTFDYIQREVPKIPAHLPILVLANHRDMGHHRTVTEDQVRTFLEEVERWVMSH